MKDKPTILVTGGAGYIGSHVAKQLLEQGEEIVIVDNLSTGSTKTLETLQKIKPFTFIELDLNDFEAVDALLKKASFETILHFAASIVVPESVQNPLKYYMNNTVNTTNFVQCAIKHGVKQFIFSSTAAVYGEPLNMPEEGINETFETKPINPYGMSKLMSERVIQDAANAHPDFKYVIFRYFNVAGADMGSDVPRIGQSFPNATHLIKIALECAAHKRAGMSIFGEDYPTQDGTCVRDYIHVDDLAYAHIQAIDYLKKNSSDIFNIGYGKGYSVKEVIKTLQEITCKDFPVSILPRRKGDPASLIANNTKIISLMKWEPRYNNLNLICKSAYEWEQKRD